MGSFAENFLKNFFLKREKLINDEHDKISYNDCWKHFKVVGRSLPSLTSCTNTGLSPLTVSPKPFSSFWIITHRWTRPANQKEKTCQ